MNTMRASDLDREQIVARLRGAFEEGRLTMDEYVGRMETACQARTHGELASLCDDLPLANGAAVLAGGAAVLADSAAPLADSAAPLANSAAPLADSAATPRPGPGSFALLPGVLKVMWTIWFAVVSINVVVWATVSLTGPQWTYPWPLWVAGPWGAMLLAISASVVVGRRGTR
jgi:hypothetical protein